jgi:hypothetical protein
MPALAPGERFQLIAAKIFAHGNGKNNSRRICGLKAALDICFCWADGPYGQRAKLSVDGDVLLWIRLAPGPEYLKKRDAFSLRLSEHNCCQQGVNTHNRTACRFRAHDGLIGNGPTIVSAEKFARFTIAVKI